MNVGQMMMLENTNQGGVFPMEREVAGAIAVQLLKKSEMSERSQGRISLSIVITHILIDHLQNSVFVSKIIVFTGVIPLNDGQEIPLFPHNLLGKF
jgi:hypothetical protein